MRGRAVARPRLIKTEEQDFDKRRMPRFDEKARHQADRESHFGD